MIAWVASALFLLAATTPQSGGIVDNPASSSARSSGRFEHIALEATSARTEKRDDDAIQLYRQGLKIRPDWDEGLWYLSVLLYGKGNYFEADDTFRRFMARNPNGGGGWAMLGLSEYETREYAHALNCLEHGLSLGVGDNKSFALTVYYVTAILLIRFERFDQSMGLLDGLIESGENSDKLIEPLGLAALRLPLLPEEIPPAQRPMIRLAGIAAFDLQTQHYGEAEKRLKKLETTYPDQPGVHFFIGAYLLDHRPEEGMKEMEREIEISPSHVPARIRISEELLKRQEISKAITFAQQAERLAPNDPLTHMALGEALKAGGDLSRALPVLETARDGAPDLARIHWDLVRAYTAAGRAEEAGIEVVNWPLPGGGGGPVSDR